MKHDVLVIGAGIVGLATAYRLLEKNPRLRVIVVEKERAPAAHQTGHNSGVMHSGIYYKPGSLKAVNCVNGYNQLINFCRAHDIPFDICGKIIVAVKAEQLPVLERIYERGVQNGLTGIRKITPTEIREKEPHVTTGLQGIFVPQAGIINYKQVAGKLAEQIRQRGGEIVFSAKTEKITITGDKATTHTSAGDFSASVLVNCAGLYSDTVARLTHPELNMRIIPFRGEYYTLKKEKQYLVRNLIYPVPDPNFPFLGVHFTRMIEGGIEAGPNAVFAFRKEGYRLSDFHAGEFFEALSWSGFRKVSMKYWRTGLREMHRSFSKAAFTKALQELIPEIQPGDLEQGGAGVRAQAVDRDGNLIDDFAVLEAKRTLNVCNAPSPAATSCLSIGDYIAAKAAAML